MHAYPSKMTSIGQRLATTAGTAKGHADTAKPAMEKPGTGNEGFGVVAAAAQAAKDWYDHAVSVAGHVKSAGDGLVASANDIRNTDLDNERGMPGVPPAAV